MAQGSLPPCWSLLPRESAVPTPFTPVLLQVMLSGINQVVLGDKRTMKFAHCGSASSLHFAVTAPPKESA